MISLALVACSPSPNPSARAGDTLTSEQPRLPNGLRLDPAGATFDVGSMPLAMVAAPEGDRIVLLLNGYREQGIQVVDRNTGRVLQTLTQPAAFLGLTFAPDGRTLYASGGNQDVIYRYAWRNGAATLTDSLVLAVKRPNRSGTRYPAGIALSPDGATLYVAENLADSLAVVDLATGRVTARFATERYPYGVVTAPDGRVYVSAWGGNSVSVFAPATWGALTAEERIAAPRHPSALLLNGNGSRLFVASGSTDRIAVVDTRAGRVVTTLEDPPPAGPAEGSTPNALALSAEGTRLFGAEADANAVAVFDLTAGASRAGGAAATTRPIGRIPVGWYPTALVALGDTLVVANGKGRGTGPNPNGPSPTRGRSEPRSFSLGQLSGTVTIVGAARAPATELAQYTDRVARANGWNVPRTPPAYPPFEHVIYIVKENRTYDQVLSDLREGDGDTSLLFFPRPVSPNHHALAERFGLFDRFFVNAEVSPDGHNWSMAAYVSDYVQKTVPSHYSDPSRGRTYDYEGLNRGWGEAGIPDDDVSEPANGYLWNLAERGNISFRNYGEFVVPTDAKGSDEWPAGYRGNKPFLRTHTNPAYPGYDLKIKDQRRADVWLADLAEFTRRGEMPRLQILRLPNDHTAGARAGEPTPHAYMADNDLALGRIIAGLSSSPFWRSTVVFVLEDDAQNGPDHVDSHRSVLLVISPYNRPGVQHRFVNTTDVLLTIEDILGIGSMSQFDYFGRPLRGLFATTPDLTPYTTLTPSVDLDARNPSTGRDARESARLDLRFEDVAEEDLFNRILWRAIKGDAIPYPGTTRLTGLEMKRTAMGHEE